MGKEPYYIDCIVKELENTVVEEADKDFNQNVFYGNDSDILDVMACAQQYPVMAPRKLVILKEAQTMNQSKSRLEKLAPYMTNPSDSTVFVLVYKGDELSATSKLIKAAGKSDKCVIFKSPELKEYQLSGPVKDYCMSKKVAIDEKAVSMLCDYIGNPLDKLFGEIDKLILAKGSDKTRITPKDIEDNIGISKDYNIFELTKALGNKDYQRCVRIIRYFSKNPRQNPTVMVTGSLFNLFSNILISHYTADKSDSSLSKATGAKNIYALRDIRNAMSNYNASQAVRGLHYIREFDTKSKGINSFQNEYDLLFELVFKLITN